MTPLRSLAIVVALIVGCASASTISVSAPPTSGQASTATEVAGCPLGTRVVFHEVRADGSTTLLGLHCGRESELEIGEVFAWGEGGSERIAIDMDEADAIWRIAQEHRWREWETCRDEGARPRFEVEVDDGSSALMFAHCDGRLPGAWSATLEALRNAEPEVESFEWPFDGDYWRDELGYYRTARR